MLRWSLGALIWVDTTELTQKVQLECQYGMRSQEPCNVWILRPPTGPSGLIYVTILGIYTQQDCLTMVAWYKFLSSNPGWGTELTMLAGFQVF